MAIPSKQIGWSQEANLLWEVSNLIARLTQVTSTNSGGGTITLSGAVTGSGATSITTTLANSVVGVSNLSATGTPSASTYLRGDNTWAAAGGSGWELTGNAGTNPATNFIGTSDNQNLRFRTNNVERMVIDSLGKVGINGAAEVGNSLTVTGQTFLNNAYGTSLILGQNSSLRWAAGTSGAYIDGNPSLTGTIAIRATTLNLSYPAVVMGDFTSGIITSTAGGSNTSTFTGPGITSIRIGNTVTGKTWFFENTRHGTSGSLEISTNVGSTTKALVINPTTYAVGINTTTDAAASAQLDVVSTTKGFLPPRMTTAQRDAISSPATGLQVYNTTTNTNNTYNGAAWVDVVTSSNYEGLNIAFGTSTGTKIGTATSQKIGLWNTAPDVQPTTAIAAAAFVANTSLIADDSATFGGYTIGQIVAALKRIGALA